jgi:hypothetical protein
MQTLDASLDDWYSSNLNTSMNDVKNTIFDFGQKLNSTENYSIWCDTWAILSW